jgi:hypothetical protein
MWSPALFCPGEPGRRCGSRCSCENGIETIRNRSIDSLDQNQPWALRKTKEGFDYEIQSISMWGSISGFLYSDPHCPAATGLSANSSATVPRSVNFTARPADAPGKAILPSAGAKANAVQRTGETYPPLAITYECAHTITHPGPRTSNGSSILTRPSVGRS